MNENACESPPKKAIEMPMIRYLAIDSFAHILVFPIKRTLDDRMQKICSEKMHAKICFYMGRTN